MRRPSAKDFLGIRLFSVDALGMSEALHSCRFRDCDLDPELVRLRESPDRGESRWRSHRLFLAFLFSISACNESMPVLYRYAQGVQCTHLSQGALVAMALSGGLRERCIVFDYFGCTLLVVSRGG